MQHFVKSILASALGLLASVGSAQAQLLDFSESKLVSGIANEVGAIYEFNNVREGINAQVSINQLENVVLNGIDATDSGSLIQPSMIGTLTIDPFARHSVDLTIRFFNGNGDAVRFQNLEMDVTDADIMPLSGGILKFAQLTTHASLPAIADTDISYQNVGNAALSLSHNTALLNLPINSPTSMFSVSRNDVHAVTLQMGWFGRDQVAVSPLLNATAVPEPSTSIMAMAALFPLILRRKR